MPDNLTLHIADWPLIRAEYEAGGAANSIRQLEKRHPVSRETIRRRCAAESWRTPGRDKPKPGASGSRPGDTSEKAPATPPALSGTIIPAGDDDEAEQRQAIIRRHRDEWPLARDRVYAGLIAHRAAATVEDRRKAFDDLKAGKISAEALAIIQANERRAWSIGTDQLPLVGARLVRVIFGDPYAEPAQEQQPTEAPAVP